MPTTVKLNGIAASYTPILFNYAYVPSGTIEINLKQKSQYRNFAGQVTYEEPELYSCLHLHIPLSALSLPRDLRSTCILNILSDMNLEREVCNYLAPIIADCVFCFTGGSFIGFFIRAEVEASRVEVVVNNDGVQAMMELFMRMDGGDDEEEVMWMDGVDVVQKMGASRFVIEKLKEERKVDGSASGELGMCMVCLEDLSGVVDLIKMPCSHLFHEMCVCRWLKEKNSCPICRCEVDGDD